MKFWQRYRKLILGLLVVVIFAAYYVLNKSDFAQLQSLAVGPLLAVALGYMAIVLTNGLFIKYIVQPFNVRLSAYESTRVSLISSLGNFFAASGAGLGFRAVYLKRRHGLEFKNYLTTLYGNYLIIFIVNAAAGIVSLLVASTPIGLQYKLALLFFVALLAVSLTLCVVAIPHPKNKSGMLSKVSGLLAGMTAGWKVIAKDRRLLLHLSSLVFVQLVITVVITHLEVTALGMRVAWPGLLLLSVLSSLSVFVSITPANLGVKELVYVLIATVVGLNSGQILSIALVDRLVLFLTLGLLWALFGRKEKGDRSA